MKPVFRSCDVAPAFAAAMQTIAPTHSAIGEYQSPVHPSATKIVQVRISVAIVIPETGFDEDPISPTIRDETVTKKKPKMIVSTAATTLPCVGNPGATARNTASTRVPMRTIDIGRSRSVRACVGDVAPPRKSFTLSRNDETIVGIVRARV